MSPSLCFELIIGGADPIEVALKIIIDALIPFIYGSLMIFEACIWHDPGIGKESIQLAELLYCGIGPNG